MGRHNRVQSYTPPWDGVSTPPLLLLLPPLVAIAEALPPEPAWLCC